MTVKVTMPNNSSDSVDFINATGTTLAQVKAYDDGSSNGHLELYTTASGTSAERVRVTSAGNVGIGTSSPAAPLHVSYTTESGLRLANTSGTPSDWTFQTLNSGILRFYSYTAGAERMRIDNSGNFLVGTTSSSAVGGGVVLAQAGYSMTAGQGIGFNIGYNGGFKYVGNGYGLLINQTNGDTVFQRATNNVSGAGAAATLTESMRIDSSGNLLVGTTSGTGERVAVIGASGFATSSFRVSSNGNPNINFRNDTGTVAGSITTGASTTAYNTSSDYRLKENIAPMAGALTTVAQLKPVTYTWKVDGATGQGFIAHELQEVVPECVTGEKDAVDADGNPQYQGIDTSFLVATLTAAIQELSAKNDALEARIAALENK